MVNKDSSLDISNKTAAIEFDTITRNEASEKDLILLDNLIQEVNSYGYSIQYFFQLQAFSIKDRCLLPVIEKYIEEFEDPDFSILLLGYLGVPKLYEATEFLIKIFSQPNRMRYPHSPMTTRQAAASSLFRIKDKRFQKQYRNLIIAPDTHTDSRLLIELLGFFENEENYSFLYNLLNDPFDPIRASAIRALSKHKQHREQLLPILTKLSTTPCEPIVKESIRYALRSLNK